MVSVEQIRAWAMALPEASEKQHFRLKVPLWQVRGKTFLGMGGDETTAVFCIPEEAAAEVVAADPELGTPVRRSDATRSFLGLEVQLRGIAPERAEALVVEAWRAQAPKRLVSELLG
ncbi:MmcQ/YjbR family DNA-binding protein [Nocardioides sp.]|uniref:MmcQ/YjbR family DNA-binding protein n=1 Tax=Nocardioides sp. TaxID=35761 RepID=UPI002EDBA4B6